MNHTLATATVSVALLVSGLVHGRWTDRWTRSAAPDEAASRFELLPQEVGDWEGQTIEVKPTRADEQIAGTLQRRYTNRRPGQAVAIALVCGRPGPVSIPSPDICY